MPLVGYDSTKLEWFLQGPIVDKLTYGVRLHLDNLFHPFNDFLLKHSGLSDEELKEKVLDSWIPQHMVAHKFFNIEFCEDFFLDGLSVSIKFIRENMASLHSDAFNLDIAFEQVIKNYKQKFETFNLCSYKAYSLPTFFFFDAIATMQENEKAILFGLDTIKHFKQKYGIGTDNLKTLVAHEVGHLYHYQCAQISEEDVLHSRVSLRFWMEGIAQYLSLYVCIDTSIGEMFLDNELNHRCESIRTDLYKRLENSIDEKRLGDAEAFWFNLCNEEIPGRAGYYIGYKAVEECVNKHGIKATLELNPESIHRFMLEHISSVLLV